MNAISMSILEASVLDVPTLLLAYNDCYNPGRFVFKEFESCYPKQKTLFNTSELISNIEKILNGEYNNDDIYHFLNQWNTRSASFEKKVFECLNI